MCMYVYMYIYIVQDDLFLMLFCDDIERLQLKWRYPTNALAQHYMKNHYMARAKFEVNIIDHKHNTIKRKLSEALHIHKNQPELNEKSELEHIVKYMSQ